MMDRVSPKSFQPIKPDGYVLNSLPLEAPKIEITETDNLCSPSLSASNCDVSSLSHLDGLRHHVDGLAQSEFLEDQDQRQQQQRDSCDSLGGGGGALSRRSEGGPGKCPSPSRNSPRRHSPVPYSPKRQFRARGSVTSDELSDVTLSPRRHSPVPFMPPVDRPCSLALNSAASSDEIICVSYADPFSSPTITHTSEAILAISINCSNDSGADQDVEMASSNNVNNEEVHNGPDNGHLSSSLDPSRSPTCEATMVDNDDALSEENGLSHSSDNTQQNNPLDGSRRDVTTMDAIKSHNLCAVSVDIVRPERIEDQGYECSDNANSSHSDSAAVNSHQGHDFPHRPTEESMEGGEGFNQLDAASSSDSSSDDDMDDMMPIPYTNHVGMMLASHSAFSGAVSTSHACGGAGDGAFALSGVNPEKACFCEDSGSVDSQSQQPSHIVSGYHNHHRRHSERTSQEVSPGSKTKASADHEKSSAFVRSDCLRSDPCSNQEFCNEMGHCSNGPNSRATSQRESFPSQHPSSCSSRRSSCCSKEVSPRRTPCHRQGSKTAEDFDLARIVGYPPLHFPHGCNVMLVHCALPSPFDPDLPTPPIVLTPCSSYDDLNLDSYDSSRTAENPHRQQQQTNSDVRMVPEGGMNDSERPNISRSRSFPKLHQDGDEQFQEPHQCWPVLGSSSAGHQNMVMEAQNNDWAGQAGSEKKCGDPGAPDYDPSRAVASGSLPGSPSNSRAAMIGRLRRVVERRLSGSGDCSEAAPQDG